MVDPVFQPRIGQVSHWYCFEFRVRYEVFTDSPLFQFLLFILVEIEESSRRYVRAGADSSNLSSQVVSLESWEWRVTDDLREIQQNCEIIWLLVFQQNCEIIWLLKFNRIVGLFGC